MNRFYYVAKNMNELEAQALTEMKLTNRSAYKMMLFCKGEKLRK